MICASAATEHSSRSIRYRRRRLFAEPQMQRPANFPNTLQNLTKRSLLPMPPQSTVGLLVYYTMILIKNQQFTLPTCTPQRPQKTDYCSNYKKPGVWPKSDARFNHLSEQYKSDLRRATDKPHPPDRYRKPSFPASSPDRSGQHSNRRRGRWRAACRRR